jgi:hypothetical protein
LWVKIKKDGCYALLYLQLQFAPHVHLPVLKQSQFADTQPLGPHPQLAMFGIFVQESIEHIGTFLDRITMLYMVIVMLH